MKWTMTCLGSVVMLGLASLAMAQGPGPTTMPTATTPATQPAATGSQDVNGQERAHKTPLLITIDGVQGIVQFRENEDDPWKSAHKGVPVPLGTEFRTGPRSAVRLVIHPNHVVTLDRLGTFKILQAVEENGIIKTDVGMSYGRTRYNVEAGGPDHQTNIRSPGATLSIRGTDVGHHDEAGQLPGAFSNQHQATFTPAGGKPIAFGGNQFAQVKPNATPSRLFMQQGTTNPGHHAGTDSHSEPHILQHYPGMEGTGHLEALRDESGLFGTANHFFNFLFMLRQPRNPKPIDDSNNPGEGDPGEGNEYPRILTGR